MIGGGIGATGARIIAKDPGGRFMALALTVRSRQFVIVAAHVAGTGVDDMGSSSMSSTSQVAFFKLLKKEIPKLPGHEYIVLMDANNVVDSHLDHWSQKKAPNHSPKVRGVMEMQSFLTQIGAPCDAFRCLHPDLREYT